MAARKFFVSLLSLSLGPLALAPRQAHAALDYNSYRKIEEKIKVIQEGKSVDSLRVLYELTRLGSVSLQASSISLTSHGGYLSIVEEATLSGNLEKRPRDITQDFLFQGNLAIPPLAAVHGLSVLHGDTVFHAKIHKMTYSLDDVFFDTAALQYTLNHRVAFLQQLTDHSFEATFSKLSLGEPIRVSIAYDLPMPGAPGQSVRVPTLFHPSGAPPRQAQITLVETARGLPGLQWLSPNGRVTLDSNGTHTVAYQSEYVFRRDESPSTVATLQTTAFASGRFQGEYLLIKGGLNDSLMKALSRPLEVTFLWRWNPPFAFVEMQNGLKNLSPLGLMAAQEARTLKQIVLEFAPKGHRFGLMHSVAGKDNVFLPPGEEGGDDYRKLLAYLDGFTEERIFADYKNKTYEKPEWAVTTWSDSGEIVKGRQEFLEALSTIRKGFSPRPEALRHIEMIGLGTAPTSLVDLKDPQQVADILDSVSIANVLAQWPGVDLEKCLKLKANENLRPLQIQSPLAVGLPPLLFPVFQPTSVEYRAFTLSQSHAVILPFSPSAEREALIKATSPFNDSLQLQGIDALGRKTRILSLSVRMLRSASDSGLARLWAADPDRIAEASEIDLGNRYGILTKGTYWGAGIDDARMVIQPGTTSEGTPILPKVIQLRSPPTFQIHAGMLRIQATATSGLRPWLEIYDLQGRLLFRLSLAEYRRGQIFAVPLSLLQHLQKDRVVLVLRGAGKALPYLISLRGAL